MQLQAPRAAFRRATMKSVTRATNDRHSSAREVIASAGCWTRQDGGARTSSAGSQRTVARSDEIMRQNTRYGSLPCSASTARSPGRRGVPRTAGRAIAGTKARLWRPLWWKQTRRSSPAFPPPPRRVSLDNGGRSGRVRADPTSVWRAAGREAGGAQRLRIYGWPRT